MNPLPCANFASQGSVSSNSLAILRLNPDELPNTSLYHRLAICIAAICWFVLGYRPPDDYIGKGRTVQHAAYNACGKYALVGAYFHRLRVDPVPFPAEDSRPQIVEGGVKSERSDSMSD